MVKPRRDLKTPDVLFDVDCLHVSDVDNDVLEDLIDANVIRVDPQIRVVGLPKKSLVLKDLYSKHP